MVGDERGDGDEGLRGGGEEFRDGMGWDRIG